MIKRLIFDLDNTIIPWEKEYDKVVNEVLEEIEYPHTEELYNDIIKAEVEYEENRKFFDKKEMVKYINEKLNLNLPQNFINLWLKKVPYCIPKELKKEDYEALEYLHQKYELVILTNWFKESQIKRLKNLNILKFFREVYGAEKYAKPYKESFLQAAGKNKLSECAMIGDSLEIDIKGAQNAGIEKIIWKDNKRQKEKYGDFLMGVNVISSISELKQIF